MIIGMGIGLLSPKFEAKTKMIFKDDFNRANSDVLGNGWQYYNTGSGFLTTFCIDNNTAAPKSAITSANAFQDCGVSDNLKISVKFVAYANFSGITFRRSSDPLVNTMLSLRSVDGSTMRVDRWVGGSNNTTIMTLSGLTLVNGDVWSVECNGSEIKVYQNGVLRGTVVEASGQSNTSHGIMASGNLTARFDDFTVEEI
ncbi:hypothetical protein [Niallia sp. FSL M8-0099]|uniref:hypothetical protein n=1 Tax=Niallia sp. FSL M8-0099 TaxID=2954519 RepID=UPI0030F890BC